MPCIASSEKSDIDVPQKDSHLEMNSANLKMDAKVNQENGVENVNGENGHADAEEGATHSDDASDGKGDEEKKKGADDEEGKTSDKPKGRKRCMHIFYPQNP